MVQVGLQTVLLSRQGLCSPADPGFGNHLGICIQCLWENPHHKVTSTEEEQSKDWIGRWICPRGQQKCRLEIFRNAPGPPSIENTALVCTETGPQQNLTRTRPNTSGISQKARHLGLSQAYPDLLPSSEDTVPPGIEFLDLQTLKFTAFLSAAWHSSRLAVWCRVWVSFCSLPCHLSVSSGSQSGASVTGNMQKQFRKLYCSEVALSQERRKRRAHSSVLAHTDKTATDESEREIWRGDLGRSQKTRFCQQIWTFAIMLWPDASHCFMCYLIKTYEFSIAVLESYLLRRYISPTPTGFGLYRYKSRVLRKAGTWLGIVSHEHFPAFWKLPTGQVPEGH